MTPARAYRARDRPQRGRATRERIVAAVRELLKQGTFHESTVEEVADRAGVARATLYLHFRSRLELVDAICDSFATNPALLAVREAVGLADPDAALAETIAGSIRFWSSEDAILGQLYGVVAADAAARDLVERQRQDRRGEMKRLAKHLRKSGRLPAEVSEARALSLLMVLTSYETFRELRQADLSEGELTRTLQETGRALLLSGR